MTLYLDLETRSPLDLRKVGAYVYAAHPGTEILCVGWAVDDGPVQVHVPPARPPAPLLSALQKGIVVAHNAEFEREMLASPGQSIFTGATRIPLERMVDTAVLAAAAGMPRDLEDLCIALGLDEKKDADGHRVMLKLSKPRQPSKEDRAPFWTPETKPEDFSRLYDYCKDDVEAMRAAHKALPLLSPEERDAWRITVQMNERGVRVDLPAVRRAIEEASIEEERLKLEFESRVGCSPSSPRAAAALGMESLDKVAVRRALKDPGLPDPIRYALVLRKLVARSSVKKLHAFENRTSADGRLRGQFVFCGAERTGRWSARGVQPQNFPRGLGKGTEAAFQALNAGVLDLLSGDVLKTVSEMLRGFFVGPFLVGDYAQIEARVAAWYAGQDDLIDLFRSGGDPYCEMASTIFRRSITKADAKERFLGKQVVLGCGYGMGPDKFMRTLDEQHDVQVAPLFAERAVYAYRERFTKIPKLWSRLEAAFKRVVSQGIPRARLKDSPLHMGTGKIGKVPAAFIELPSGRRLWYAYPRLVASEYGQEIRYFGRNIYKGGAWEEIHSYGGRLTENVVQATSRDLLAHTARVLDRARFPMVLTVHDELVAEGNKTRLTEFEKCFTDVPDWANGLPVQAECFATDRYRK
jgi:DNA polymerase